MASERTLTIKILGDATSARRALSSVDDGVAESESRFTKYGGAIKAAAVVGGVALLGFAKGSIDAFNESAKVGAQTEAVLKSTGGAANVTSKQVGALADKLQKLSGVEGETIQAGQNMLLTFTNIKNEAGKGNDVFDQATKTLLDMSVALGTDAKTSAIQLGKALNDPIAGVGALSRVGVTFTAEQKKLIKTLVDTGNTAGAQKVILAELNKEFGGSAKAAGDARSPMEKLSLRFGDLQEKVGGFLVPALEKLTVVGLGVIDFVSNLNPAVLGVAAAVAGLVLTVVAVAKAIEVWRAVTAAFAAVQAVLNGVLAANPIGLVVIAVAALAAGIVIAYKNSEIFRDVVATAFSVVKGAVDAVIAPIRTLIGLIKDALGFVARLAKAIPDLPDLPSLPKLPKLRIPGLAHGGRVAGGRPYIVGDGGRPELFVPDGSGRVLPSVPGSGSSSGATINNHIEVHAADVPTDVALDLAVRKLGWQLALVGR